MPAIGLFATIADVGGRSSDRPCRSEATEQRGDQVGNALSDQLLIGVMFGAGHPVGDNCPTIVTR